ncbi:MAG TPA: hypothetical protein VEZ88_12515 [Steroidobacteraceae bacterium]|nr:hypothetical protein [Steroidobacteraceae bacterium]
MLQHAEQFAAAGIAFLFDRGQALPMFSGAELVRFIERARKRTASRTQNSPSVSCSSSITATRKGHS